MNIYVSNLGYEFQTEELVSLFMEYGAISSAKIIVDKFTNRSRGFGFIEMPDRLEAEKAIQDLNGKEIDGRNISVVEARPPKERSGYSNRY